jgi:hypothetical protein
VFFCNVEYFKLIPPQKSPPRPTNWGLLSLNSQPVIGFSFFSRFSFLFSTKILGNLWINKCVFSSVILLNFVLLWKFLLNFYITKLKEIKIKTLLYVDRFFFPEKKLSCSHKKFLESFLDNLFF